MVKKIIYFIFILIIFSCSSGDSNPLEQVPPVVENKVPTKPNLVYPTDKLLCIDNNLNFQWQESTDEDGDAINYTIEIASDNQFAEVVHNFNNLNTNSKLILTEKGKAFYWRVRAKDSNDNSSDFSEVFQFYTEGIGEVNYLPFSPELIAPKLNTIISNIDFNLEWNASDVDTDDTLLYDVYLGTTESPALVSENQTEKKYLASLESGKTYYWKVVVKDDKNGVTIGQVWNFKTN